MDVLPDAPRSKPETTARGVLRLLLGGTGLALYIGLAAWAYSAMLADDMLTAAILLFLAWLIGVCALTLSEVLGAFKPRKRLQLNAAFAVALFLLTGILWGYFYSRRPAPAIASPLLAAQIQELKEVQAFIGGKDENDLRETFDYPGIVKYNILLMKRGMFPKSVSPEESVATDTFFKNGQAELDSRFMTVERTAGGFRAKMIPGEVGIINLSRKHVDAIRKLQEFESSPSLPQSIRAELHDFHAAITKNDLLMFDVFNEQLRGNLQNLLYENSDSPYLGAMSGPYWSRFVQLHPKAEKLNHEISKYLGTDMTPVD